MPRCGTPQVGALGPGGEKCLSSIGVSDTPFQTASLLCGRRGFCSRAGVDGDGWAGVGGALEVEFCFAAGVAQ